MKIKHFTVSVSPNTSYDTQVMDSFLAGVKVHKISTQFVPAEVDFWSILVFYEEAEQEKPAREAVAVTEEDLTEDDRQLLAALRTWRRDQAVAQNVPEYLICPNSALIGVAKIRPLTPGDLSAIKGFGETKVARYGGDLLTIVNSFE